MKECRYCKSSFKDDEVLETKTLSGDTFYTCSDCDEDILNFFKSGKAEKRKIQQDKPYLTIQPSYSHIRSPYTFVGKFLDETFRYENVEIDTLETTPEQRFMKYRGAGIVFNPNGTPSVNHHNYSDLRGYKFSVKGVLLLPDPNEDPDVPF